MKRIKLYIHPFLAYQQGHGRAQSTVKRSMYYLKRLSGFLDKKDVRDVSCEDILDYIMHIRTLKNNRGKVLSERSIQVELTVLKGFFIWLYKSEYILTNPTEDITLLRSVSGDERKIFTEKEMFMFLDSIGILTPDEQRDRAVFELMYSSGLRVSEISSLKVEEVNLEERICLLKRKGNKDGYVPFSGTALKFLLKYIVDGRKKYVKLVRNPDFKTLLFLNRNGKMSWKSIRGRFRKYLKRCGLENKGYVIHSIRHATATHLIAHGASMRYVQELLGHADLKTTQVYTRPTEENIKSMYRMYHPRENEYYKEVDKKYLAELKKLKDRIVWQKKETKKQKERLRRQEKKKLLQM
jgi:site-specific recombinase XerD